jgi:hypothetical protein
MAILGDRGTTASGAFRLLLQYSLDETHTKMEQVDGADLVRLQGACQLIRGWLSNMERASARAAR